MLIDTQGLKGFHLKAGDGEIGKVLSFFFDDVTWTIRYIVVRTGRFMLGREVLIAPESVRKVSLEEELLHVSLTTEKIKDSPDVDSRLPVSRQRELELFRHYGWVPYWHPPLTSLDPGFAPMPPVPPGDLKGELPEERDPNLRDVEEVTGYRVAAADGQIGHVEGFLLDDRSWALRYVIVDTRNWLPGGRKVLFPVEFLTGFSWEDRTADTGLTIRQIQGGPEYDPSQAVSGELEETLHGYYGQPGHWLKDAGDVPSGFNGRR